MVTLTKFIYIYTFWMFWPRKHAENILRHQMCTECLLPTGYSKVCERVFILAHLLWIYGWLDFWAVTQQSSFWSYVWDKLPNSYYQMYCVCCCSVVSDCATAWTVTHQAPLPWDFQGKNTVGVCHSILQGIFLTQGLNPCLLLWQIRYRWATRECVYVRVYLKLYEFMGTSFVVQWLRLHSQWRDPGFDPWWGTKIPHAATWHK